MAYALVFIVTGLCLWLTRHLIYWQYKRGALTAGRFAITFALGWSLSISACYFLGLTVVGGVVLDRGLTALGIGLGLANLVVGLIVTYVLYRPFMRILARLLRMRRPSASPPD